MGVSPTASSGDSGRARDRDRIWIVGLASLQCAWFVIRWRMGGNAIDGHLLGVLAAALAVGWAAANAQALTRVSDWGGWTPRRLALFAFAVEGIAVLVQPPGWDEAWVLRAAQAVADDGFAGLVEQYRANKWLGQRHPPLGPSVLAIGIRVFGDGAIGARLTAAAFAAATVATTAWIARDQLGDTVARRAGWMLLGFPLFVRLGGAAMTDIVVTCLFTWTVALAVRQARHGGPNLGGALGLLIVATFATKYTGLLVLPVLIAAYAALGILRTRWKELAVAGLLLTTLAVLGALWLESTDSLSRQLRWVLQVAGAATGGNLLFGRYSPGEAVLTKLPSAVGLYTAPLVVIGVLLARGRPARLLYAWVALVLVPLLVTLPDNRYFLPAFPALAILAAIGVGRVFREPARGLSLSLGLCLVTVGFYALLPNREPVFLLERVGRRDASAQVSALARVIEPLEVIQHERAHGHRSPLTVERHHAPIRSTTQCGNVGGETPGLCPLHDVSDFARDFVEQLPTKRAERGMALELAHADLEQQRNVDELPLRKLPAFPRRGRGPDTLPERPERQVHVHRV